MEEGEGRPPAGDGWTAALELDRAPESRQASAALLVLMWIDSARRTADSG